MKASNVKTWARIGQIAYWFETISYALYNNQRPDHVPAEFSGTVIESIYILIGITAAILFSEAIVKVIGYFAELLEERK